VPAASLIREVFAVRRRRARSVHVAAQIGVDVRPLISDLRLTTVVYDGPLRLAQRRPWLRDITIDRIYRVKTGDHHRRA